MAPLTDETTQTQPAGDLSGLTPVDSKPESTTPDLSSLTPVEGSEKKLSAGEDLSGLTAVEGSEKKLATPQTAAQASAQAAGPATSIGPRRTSMPEEGMFLPVPTPGGSTMVHIPKGVLDSAETMKMWAEDLQKDIENGTASTWIGAILKRMGAKGTHYGVDPGTAQIGDMLTGLVTGPPKLMQAPGLAAEGHPVQAVNKAVEGAFQTLGPAALVAAPEATIAAAPSAVTAMGAGHIAGQVAKYFGMDDDDAELVNNAVALLGGPKIHSKFEVERFENAVTLKQNTETVYQTRQRELEVARNQAKAAQDRAIETAQRELNGQATKADTDAARTNASEAAKNADNARKAFDTAHEERAEASLRLKRFSRGIQQKAQARAEQEANAIKKGQDISRETLQKAIPAKGTDIYTPDESGNYPKYDIVRAHLEAAKDRGLPTETIADSRNAVESQRQGIEDSIKPYIEKYGEESLVDDPAKSPKMLVQDKLDQMARVDGNFKDAMDHLTEFNITDLTVKDAQDTLTKLNDYMRAQKKLTNNWDIYNQIETNPKFASMYFMADELRDALYNKLESHDVKGIREARTEEAALIDFRNAADAQLRRNAGAVTVRGSGEGGAIRNLVARLTGKAIKGAGIAIGAKTGGTTGAVLGGAIGEMIGEPVQDFISPADLTRDEHVAKAMKTRGTTRKPAQITGAGTPAVPQPALEIPPVPKAPEGPQNLRLAPRENTDLHADLATHYGLADLDERNYHELEQDLRDEVREKREAGVKLTPEEKKLWNRVMKLDAADRAAKAETEKGPGAAAQSKTEEALKKDKEDLAASAIWAGLEPGHRPLEMNQELKRLGRPRETALVSHPANPEMMAHSPIMPIANLPEGFTSQMAMEHEFAHAAIAAVDGMEPELIRSNLHPESQPHAGATTVLNVDKLRDVAGNIDEEKFRNQEVQWLTQKMAGPAWHELQHGMTRDQVKAIDATRSDFYGARQVVRELHPDFSPAQVEMVIDAAMDRASNFLSKSHIADRVRANASVRENNLSDILHASPARMAQFIEDIRNSHAKYTGNEPSPGGGESGEGGEKAEKPAAQGETKNEGGDRVGRGGGS